ncbi:MAG: hypothetical protein ABIP13_02685 [Tepidiformaceae bacterium]
MPKTPPNKRPPTPSLEGRRSYLSPRFTLPALAITTVAAVVLAVLVALGVNGDRPQALTVTTCQAGTPGCQLRTPTHVHANFALVIRGKPFDFDQAAFLSVENNDRSAVAHLHTPRFDVVHVHRTGTFWDEFFKSIGFELTDPTLPGVSAQTTCLKMPDGQKLCNSATEAFKFYANGVKVDGIAVVSISDLDRVLISYGDETDAIVSQQQLTLTGDDACIPSERCKSRIPKGGEPEPCTLSNDTCVKSGG